MVVGNPTNPTSVLHRREQLLALRRPGRILVVDEAFADSIPGEPESLAAYSLPDVLVLRSLTKTWSLAGLRVGYALGSPEVLARLTAQRAHWPVGTLQLDGHRGLLVPLTRSPRPAPTPCGWPIAHRDGGRSGIGGRRRGRRPGPVCRCSASRRVFSTKSLPNKGIAVRRCDTFVGLDERYLRAAVRREWPLLVQAISEAMPVSNSGRLR